MSWADDATESELRASGFYAEPQQEPPVARWKTKDGTLIDVKDMETSHIKNCINLLQRGIFDPYQWGEPDGDHAHDAFLQGVRQQEAYNRASQHNIDIFNKELKRRGEQ